LRWRKKKQKDVKIDDDFVLSINPEGLSNADEIRQQQKEIMDKRRLTSAKQVPLKIPMVVRKKRIARALMYGLLGMMTGMVVGMILWIAVLLQFMEVMTGFFVGIISMAALGFLIGLYHVLRKWSNMVEIVILTKTKNIHHTVRLDEYEIERNVEYDSKVYNLKIVGLFKDIVLNPLKWIWDKAMHTRNRFMILFVEGKSDPIELQKEGTITGELLYNATYSKILTSMIKEQFSSMITVKKALFIFGVLVFVAVFVLFILPMIQSGAIHI